MPLRSVERAHHRHDQLAVRLSCVLEGGGSGRGTTFIRKDRAGPDADGGGRSCAAVPRRALRRTAPRHRHRAASQLATQLKGLAAGYLCWTIETRSERLIVASRSVISDAPGSRAACAFCSATCSFEGQRGAEKGVREGQRRAERGREG